MPRVLGLPRALALAGLLLPTSPALAQVEQATGPRPAHVHEGSCRDLGPVAFSLENLTHGFTVEAQGQEASRAAELGVRYLAVPLATLLTGEYAIDVHEHDQDDGNPIACGEIGGSGDEASNVLAVALTEEDGSGAIGIAYLVALTDGGTSAALFLAEEATPTAQADEPAMEPTADATAEPTSEPTAETAAGETYFSPTFGYELTYDADTWSIADGPTTDADGDYLALEAPFTTVHIGGIWASVDVQQCLAAMIESVPEEPDVVGIEVQERGGDADDAFTTHVVIRATEGGGEADQVIYTRCIALVPGEAVLVIQQYAADIIYDAVAADREALLAGLVLP